MRINQYLAAASGLSRRAADTAVTAGRVTVNGQPAKLGQNIDPTDMVCLDTHQLTPPAADRGFTYIMMNKPAGYVSSHTRQGDDPTLYELLPAKYHRLRLVGRLDRDSSGLVLLTDDGQFIQQHAHPSSGKSKHYELTLSRALTAGGRQQLQAGVQLRDGLSQVHVTRVDGRRAWVSLSEGRNRQLRRTLGQLGYGIVGLHRTHIGPFALHELASGQWQPFSPEAAA
jgi:23S rRNA pseudouridine2605 synthase